MNERKKIYVLYVRRNEYPFRMQIDCTEARMQELLKGPLEVLRLQDDALIIHNANAQLDRLPPNRAVLKESTYEEFYDDDPCHRKELTYFFGPLDTVIYGDFLVAYAGPNCNEFTDLPEDLEKKYKKRFHFPETFFDVTTAIYMKHFIPETTRDKNYIER